MAEKPAQDSSLPQFLAWSARTASDGRLALFAAAGLLLAAGAAVARPWGFVMLVSAGACLAAFGFWGIVDRELSERRARIGIVAGALLQSARVAAAVLGVLGGLGAIFGGVAVMLGTWTL